MHSSTIVQLGSTRSNHKDVSKHESDPATFLAGLCVSLKDDATLSLLKADGFRIGVSLGKGLSNDSKCTSVLRAGESVPVRAHLKRASGVITVTSYANLVAVAGDDVVVGATTFTAQSGAVTPGDATFRAATGNNETAASLAAQINAHATASAKVYAVAASAVVTLYSVVDGAGSTATGNDIVLTYTDNGTATVGITLSGLSGGKLSGGSDSISAVAFPVIGGKMYINDVTGKADKNIAGFTTISDATYRSGVKTGRAEDGSSVAAVIVDMPGGL